ncbi:beta-galactosidase 15 [Forsythia ovata]|uniref:Beta-galactosidase 15 n=1 Tax=Forsythia ovata TaxID=205694 RepID=A0ABD1V017_9LAMI
MTIYNCRYHVPRSFFQDDVNELVLFEEFGGNPTLVNFQTLRVGTACGSAYENKDMELSCQGRPISAIKFASFGDVQGTCGSYYKGTCAGQNDALSIIQNACVGKESCTVSASESTFGAADCAEDISKRLIVEAVC